MHLNDAKDPIPSFRPLIVGIGGTTQATSSSERAARVVLRHAEALGAETRMFAGVDLIIPIYDYTTKERDPKAIELVDTLRKARGLVLSSPSYHGLVSGHIKNALDYTEDMREDKKPYLSGRVVGCIGCGAGDQGANSTLNSLRMMVHALRGWPTSMGAAINTSQPVFDSEGNCTNPKIEAGLKLIAEQMVRFARLLHLAYAFDPDWGHWVETKENMPRPYV